MQSIPARTIVTRTRSEEWFGARYNMNIYRGCSHGCIYCDSRSSCYRNPDFDTVVKKENALAIIRDELRRKVQKGVVATGAMSDPYNPFEERLQLTRHALELLWAYGFGAAVDTKSDLVVRDRDILVDIARQMPVLVKFSITAAEDAVAARTEPRAPSSTRRFAAMARLAGDGLFTGLLLMPVLPGITDSRENIRELLRRAAGSGARFAYCYPGLTMREGQREYFYAALDREYPGLSERYRRRYGSRYRCPVPGARALWEFYREECSRLGLLTEMRDIISASRQGYGEQMSLF
ncbi:MAG: radical SAM protein [Clostridiales bacterium]|nr:radical SAM protein [Clostridiales bacterium]